MTPVLPLTLPARVAPGRRPVTLALPRSAPLPDPAPGLVERSSPQSRATRDPASYGLVGRAGHMPGAMGLLAASGDLVGSERAYLARWP